MSVQAREIAVESADGHRWTLLARIPDGAKRSLLWLPALGIAARHYVPFAEALAARGVAVFVHEWRGNGSSSLRAARHCDWGYRELLELDIPASRAAIEAELPGLARAIGGHSLGGQLACCQLALAPSTAGEAWLAGSGAPYWRAFPYPHRLWLPLAYRFLPWLAERKGYLPGRAIGFGGNEARGLIRDWARTAISGRYAAEGVATDIEAAFTGVRARLRAAVFAADWLAPESSARFLLSKMPGEAEITVFDAGRLGAPADHYAWMKHPEAVAAWFAGRMA